MEEHGVPGESAMAAKLDVLARLIHLGASTKSVTRDEAFAVLYERQFGRVYAFLRYRLGDELLAEDLTAEVFARAWAKLTDLQYPDKATAWLFTTARNLLTDHYRAQPVLLPLTGLPPEGHPVTDGPEMRVLAEERLELIQRCLGDLSEREREIVGLRFVAGLRNREIALVLSMSEGNVAKIIHRATSKVRKRLHEEYSDG
jgi:RNA polymerase sigma-70 factor, ECF subfamily